MSEMRDMVAIFGEIDRALVENREARQAVAQLLPEYEDPEVQWYDAFVEWVREHREVDEGEPFPTFEEALEDLGRIRPEGRMLARRVLAVTTMARAIPAVREPGAPVREFAGRTLSAAGLITDDRAGELLDFLAEPERTRNFNDLLPDRALTPDEYWDGLMTAAFQLQMLPHPNAIGSRPCTGTLVELDGDDGGPAVKIVASVPTRVGFEAALGFLNPENWVAASAFWCEMALEEEVSDTFRRYRETVSVDCPNRTTTWQLQARLDFQTTIVRAGGRGMVASADYQLTPPHPQPGDDVEVDFGSLSIEPDDTGTRVTATKIVRFKEPFNGRVLALVICALGYASALEDLVEKTAGMPGPVEPPQELGPDGSRRFGDGAATEAPVGDSLVDDMIDEAARWAKACISECATSASASAKRIDDGQYTADAFVQDVAAGWVRVLREGARGAGAAIETTLRERGRNQ